MRRAGGRPTKIWLLLLTLCLMMSLLCVGSLSASAHQNPFHVAQENKGFGDPYILKHNGVYYLYGTICPMVHVWASRDLVSWAYRGACMQGDNAQNPYAPEVKYFDGVFYMYSAPEGNGHYVYTSTSPTGPFTAATENLGYRFDGSMMMDGDNQIYFIVPSNGGLRGMYLRNFTTIDRTSPAWSIPVGVGPLWTEGPTLFKRLGKYYMTYTGNRVWQYSYQVQYAVSDDPVRGWTEPADNVLLLDVEGDIRGLGHNSIFVGPDLDTYYITYHNLYDTPTPTTARRYINFDKIVWNGDKLVVQGPTSWEVDDPDLPDFYDYFELGGLDAWSATGVWTGADGAVKSSKGLLLTRQTTEDIFTAEYNFTLGAKGNAGSLLFGYTDVKNYGRIWLDPTEGTFNAQIIRDGFAAWRESIALYDGFNYTALHTVRVQQGEGQLRILLDEVERFVTEESVVGGKIGYRTDGVPLIVSYTAFSNKALGSADHENYAPVPGVVEAVHYANTEAALPQCPALGEELGNAIRMTEGDTAVYTVNVKESTTYTLSLSVASVAEDTTLELLVDGEAVTAVTLPAVSASAYRSLPVRGLSLPSGKHQLSVRVASGSLELYEWKTVADAEGTTFSSDFEIDDSASWLQYEQTPTRADGALGYTSANPAFGKLLTGSLTDTDYVLEADIRIERTDGSAGFLFRVTQAENGYNTDAIVNNPTYHQGYYLGFRGGQMTLQKQSFGEATVLATVMSDSVALGKTLHVRLEVVGDTYTIFVDGEPMLSYTDTSHPYLTGRVGLRSYRSQVTYDNFSLVPTEGILLQTERAAAVPSEAPAQTLWLWCTIGAVAVVTVGAMLWRIYQRRKKNAN